MITTALTSKGSGFHLPTHGTDGAYHHAHIVSTANPSISIRSENGSFDDANAALNSYVLCGYGCIGRGWHCDGRSAKPRGAAPSSFAALADSLAQDRATSHNGARYTTLPFQAQPRVRLRSKKAARALATCFELRRPLRAET